MQAVILAGGKGTRLRPYTTVLPKPLMPIGDYPILEIVIRQLRQHNFGNVVMAVGHLKELIQAFFDHGARWGIDISYSFESEPLGTAAPIKLIKDLDDDFLVMNGDILTTLNYGHFFDYHKASYGLCTIAAYQKPVKIDLGVLSLDRENRITLYTEKPTLVYDVSMGIYAFNKEVLKFIPDNKHFDFPDLINTLLERGQVVTAYPFDGYWLDIGRPSDYDVAVEEFEKNKGEFLEQPCES